jgi:hypothetical protein
MVSLHFISSTRHMMRRSSASLGIYLASRYDSPNARSFSLSSLSSLLLLPCRCLRPPLDLSLATRGRSGTARPATGVADRLGTLEASADCIGSRSGMWGRTVRWGMGDFSKRGGLASRFDAMDIGAPTLKGRAVAVVGGCDDACCKSRRAIHFCRSISHSRLAPD